MATPYNSNPFVPPTFLNITAISAQNGSSVLECWQILPGFSTSPQAGTTNVSVLQLGNVANMSYTVVPPQFNAGLHNAPTTQYVTSRTSTHSPIFTSTLTGKMGCSSIGSRAHHPPQLYSRCLCPWREEWLHLCGGHGGSELKGPLDELPVKLRDHRTANPHRGYHSPAQRTTLGSV
jgi:hypothetical protein